jgi:hypothetical protein
VEFGQEMTLQKTKDVMKLSIVVASLDSPVDLKNCLERILKQVRISHISARTNAVSASIGVQLGISNSKVLSPAVVSDSGERIEIIIANCFSSVSNDRWLEEFRAIEFIDFPAKTSLAKLLGAAIVRAKGEIIAITDSSCAVADDWVSSILRAHEAEESPVIGGSVEISENENLTSRAAYFCDYGQFMLPAPRGTVGVVPGNNLSIKRRVLDESAEFVRPEFWKTLWCRKLQSEGARLFSAPEIRVNWRKSYKFTAFLARRFHQGRCFAGMRFAKETFFKRLFYSAGTVFLPFLFLFRISVPIFQRKRFRRIFLLSLPIIILAVTFWSAGETIGFLAGTGTSCGRID